MLLGSLGPAEVHPDKRRASPCTTPTLRNRRFFPYISASLWGSSPHTSPPSSHTCCFSHHTLKLVPAPQFLADLQLPLIQRTQCKGCSGVSEPRPQKTQQLALPASRNPVPRSQQHSSPAQAGGGCPAGSLHTPCARPDRESTWMSRTVIWQMATAPAAIREAELSS